MTKVFLGYELTSNGTTLRLSKDEIIPLGRVITFELIRAGRVCFTLPYLLDHHDGAFPQNREIRLDPCDGLSKSILLLLRAQAGRPVIIRG